MNSVDQAVSQVHTTSGRVSHTIERLEYAGNDPNSMHAVQFHSTDRHYMANYRLSMQPNIICLTTAKGQILKGASRAYHMKS